MSAAHARPKINAGVAKKGRFQTETSSFQALKSMAGSAGKNLFRAIFTVPLPFNLC